MDTNGLVDRLADLRVLRQELEADLPQSSIRDKHLVALSSLEDGLLKRLVDDQSRRLGQGQVTVAVIGDFSSGKSTFINALLGTDICPIDSAPTTSAVTFFFHSPTWTIEQEGPGGTRKRVSPKQYKELVRHPGNGKVNDPFTFHVGLPSPYLHGLRLIDTPGFSNPKCEERDNEVTEAAASLADAFFVVIDIEKGNPSASLLNQIMRMRSSDEDWDTPAFLLVNKASNIPSLPARRKIVQRNRRKHAKHFRECGRLSHPASLRLLPRTTARSA